MAINKVIYGNETLIDLTSDTVAPNKVLAGTTFHSANGDSLVGELAGDIEERIVEIESNIGDVSKLPNPLEGISENIADLNSNLTANNNAFRFGYDSVNDQYGYYREVDGADTLVPFKSDPVVRTFRATMSYDSDSSGKWIYAYTPNISLEGYTPVYAGITSVNNAWNAITVARRQVSVNIENNKVKIGWYIFSGGRGNAYIDVIVVYK